MEHLLLVTSCYSPAGIGASLRTHVRTYGRTDGWTHRRDVGNNILDLLLLLSSFIFVHWQVTTIIEHGLHQQTYIVYNIITFNDYMKASSLFYNS